jgi:very-short-patch-repair endonuclease
MGEGNPYIADDAGALASEFFSGKLSVAESLKRLRTRLLDLTMRNKLLNYRHPKALSLQFTNDPDLNLLYERLEEGKSVPLAYVPDPPVQRYEIGKKPEARLYAREINIGTSVDVGPSATNTAYKRLPGLQVLQYPTDLERYARKMSSEARTVTEETGTNMLYLMFGFLEYFDSEDSQKAAHAPLLSVPVTLTRGKLDAESRTYLYDVTHSGEDVAENFTLREKLRQQFRLELPSLDEDDTPETYFAKIQKAVAKRPNWHVKHRLSLGFLSFGKLAIWADLDPDKSDSLLSSELLKDIFEGGRATSSDGFHAEDYDIDEHADGELPLIYDADSSQHSAIIDVMNGKNLVINGPPGTGKSQTITNIVASAIASGKKVLFVSEKLAALEVVKQRLEAAGLGDFCLELHSHKTQKKPFFEAIQERMTKRYRAPAGYEKRVEVLRERRAGLNRYAELLGTQAGNSLGLSIHDVFWAAERRRQALGDELEGVSGLSLSRAASWSGSIVDKHRMTLSDASVALAELGCSPKECAWLGFQPSLMVKGDELQILAILTESLSHAAAMVAAADELQQVLSCAPWTMGQLRGAGEPVKLLASATPPSDGGLLEQMFARGFRDLPEVRAQLQRLGSALQRIRELDAEANSTLSRRDFPPGDSLNVDIFNGMDVLSSAGAELPLSDLQRLASRASQGIDAARRSLGAIRATVPANAEALSSKLRAAKEDPVSSRWVATPANDLLQAASAAEAVANETGTALAQVSELLQLSHISFEGRVEELQALLDGRGLPDLLLEAPTDQQTLDELRRLSTSGWGDWTAEQFTQTSREISGLTSNAGEASEELTGLFARISTPVEATKGDLEAIEVLLAVLQEAPQELLSLRGPALERADFTDIAVRAEEAHKAVLATASKVAGTFHVDALPDDELLKAHLQVFRRGDSFFNFLRSDWRRAKAAFQACFKTQAKHPAASMASHFSTVLAWKALQREFVESVQFREVLGPLFTGMDTDFNKVRRLNNWLRASAPQLMATDLAARVSPFTLPESHIALLVSNATRLRGWLTKLQGLPKAAASLPGVDPALARVRRIADIVKPLEDYAATLTTSASLLKSVVRPVASVTRAVELLDARRRLKSNEDVLRKLTHSPAELAGVGVGLQLSDSPLSYQHLKQAAQDLQAKARSASELAGLLHREVGDEVTTEVALHFLDALIELDSTCGAFLKPHPLRQGAGASAYLAARENQTQCVATLGQVLDPYVKPRASMNSIAASVSASLQSAKALDAVAEDPTFFKLFGPALNGSTTDERALASCLAWAEAVGGVADRVPAAGERLLRQDVKSVLEVLTRCVPAGIEAFELYKGSMADFAARGSLDWATWGGTPLPSDAVARLQQAIAAVASLVPWSKYQAAKDEAHKAGLGEILGRAEQGKLSSASLVCAFEYVFHRSLARGILSEHRDLARFNGAGHERLRAEFAELDKELIALNGAMYASKVDRDKKPLAGVSSGRAGDLTETALLTKEAGKQKRHVPIRQLLKRAGKSLQELKPCFMMGPLSVAQYLEQGYLQFDLVVMDEASQLRPEDALGAIARSSQLVVVGDPKQLPPTNFFDRLTDDGDEEDPDNTPAVVDGVESILGICEHLYRPVRTLRWHYRSKHESLIAFSNSQFYDGRLVVFPSPYKRNRRLGVNYRYVGNGVYQGRRNVPEAQRVVDAIIEHMLTVPDESLGVVTLNQTQRELIEDLLDQKSRDVKGVAEYLERHEKAGWKFFVKNLENVQGDERDVIFVSTTFGKPPGSSVVPQYFGPINRPDGWRRLNVLFTRARRRVDLFTSMVPTDVKVDEKASLGRRAFREYLEYARTGLLPAAETIATDREADSDFELAVADALRAKGFDTQPQVGVAGYFIDIGVRHPDRPGEFLAGIECDGVTYHSSLSARDRDRIRQEVLESLGWRGRIIRVWSTDWFADPAAQTSRLLNFLQQRQLADQSLPSPYSDEDLAVDESPAPTPDLPLAFPATGAVTLVDSAVDAAVDLFVEVGDRVTYEVLGDAPETHTVQIVDSPSNLRLNLLNEDTPVAQALLGLGFGDEAVLTVPGHAARKLRVTNVMR